MVTPLDQAIIEIVADTSGFEDDVKTKLAGAFKDLARSAERALDRVDDSFNDSQRNLKGFSTSLENAIADIRGMDRAADGLRSTLATLDRLRGLGSLSAEGERLERILKTGVNVEMDRLRGSIDALGGEGTFDRINDAVKEAERRTERVNDALEQMRREISQVVTVAEKIDAPFRRIDDAAKDLKRTIQQINRLESFGDLNEDGEELLRTLRMVESQGFDRLEDALRKLGIHSDVFDKMKRDLRQVENAADGASRGLRGVGSAARAAGDGSRHIKTARDRFSNFRLAVTDARFAVASLGAFIAADLAGNAIQAAGALQQLEAGLRTYIEGVSGVADGTALARLEIEKIRKVALDTPFDFQELAESTRRMAAFSETTGRVGESLSGTFELARNDVKDLSGLLSVLGQGSDALNPLIKAIGDVGARGRITGEEIRQFTNALPGFNTLREISIGLEEMGVGWEGMATQAGDFAAAGITAEQTLEAFFRRVRQFPGAAEALEAQTNTLTGQLERFGEAVKFAAQDGFQPLADAIVGTEQAGRLLDPVLNSLVPAIESLGEGISVLVVELAPRLAEALGMFGQAIGDAFQTEQAQRIFADLGDLIMEFAETLSELIPVLMDVLEAIIPIVDVALQLTTGFAQLLQVLNPGTIQAIGAAFATWKVVSTFNKAMGALSISLRGIGVPAHAAASGLTFLSKVLGGLGFAALVAEDFFSGIAKQTEEFSDEIEEMAKLLEKDGVDSFQALGKAVKRFRERELAPLEQDIKRLFFGTDEFSAASSLNLAFGLINPFAETENEKLLRDYEAASRAAVELEEQNIRVAESISMIARTFGGFDLVEDFGREEFLLIADALGIDLAQGAEAAQQAIASAAAEAGGYRALLLSIFPDESIFNSHVNSLTKVSGHWQESIDAMTTYFDTLRGKTDPMFAVLDGLSKLPELRTKVTDLFNNGIPETQEIGDYLALMKEIRTVMDTIREGVAGVVAMGGSVKDLEVELGLNLEALGLPDNFLSGERSIDDTVRQIVESVLPDLQQVIDTFSEEIPGFDPLQFFAEGLLDGPMAADAAALKEHAEASANMWSDEFEKFRAGERSLSLGFTAADTSGAAARTAAIQAMRAFDEGATAELSRGEGLANFENTISSQLREAGNSLKPQAEDIGASVSKGFEEGLGEHIINMSVAATSWFRTVRDALNATFNFGSPSKTAFQWGVWVGEGFIKGIESVQADVNMASRKMTGDAYVSMREALAVASPSKLTMELGQFAAQGFAKGLDSNIGMANSGRPSSSVTTNNTRQVDAPITINASGTNSQALADMVAEKIMQKAGL